MSRNSLEVYECKINLRPSNCSSDPKIQLWDKLFQIRCSTNPNGDSNLNQ